ncbi:MAG: hypothetical protein HXM38_03055 [Isoptericola variabilis]|jgi:hypothetical protein|uniref:hypothetical protein n=1 Tax=Actinomycetes TaxID=1760 RepID=UPI00065FC042|nr:MULTISPECIES: hypothetical protein [Actinomycetes]MBF1252625.1 hypothetical protein [Isoptericola variabilis]MDK7159177.1 hypothetical protein [Pauljensenia sp. UMB3104]
MESYGANVGHRMSAPPPALSETQRRRDNKVWVIAMVVVGLLVLGVVHLMDMPRTNPEDTVRQYLTYLADGDAESALGMLTRPMTDREKRFLTNDVLSASDSRIAIESVESLTSKWSVVSRATVRATMSVNGERITHDFTVYHHKPTKDRPEEWYLFDDLLVHVAVTGDGVPGFSVTGDSAGVEPLSTGWQEYYFFPGVYTLTPEGRRDGGTVDPQTVVAIDGTGTSATENTTVRFN